MRTRIRKYNVSYSSCPNYSRLHFVIYEVCSVEVGDTTQACPKTEYYTSFWVKECSGALPLRRSTFFWSSAEFLLTYSKFHPDQLHISQCTANFTLSTHEDTWPSNKTTKLEIIKRLRVH